MKLKKGKTRNKVISIVLVLALAAGMVLPERKEMDVLAAESQQTGNVREFTFMDKDFYNAMVKAVNSQCKIKTDSEGMKLELDLDKVERIWMCQYYGGRRVNMTRGNSLEIFQQLIQDCEKLSSLKLHQSKLGEFDFSILNNKSSLKELWLDGVSLQKVPDIRLGGLTTLQVSGNNLSADDACENINPANFPNLKTLYVDDCPLSNIRFIENFKDSSTLECLSLADSRLKDESIDVLLQTNLPNLKELNVGKRVYSASGQSSLTGMNYTSIQLEKLLALTEHFAALTKLELQRCGIASLETFKNVREGVTLDLSRNELLDFAGIEDFSQFILGNQEGTIPGTFVEGEPGEITSQEIKTLIRRLRDESDALHGTIECKGCSISDDAGTLTVQSKPGSGTVGLYVKNGKLSESLYEVTYKRIPSYSIPEGLKAKVGDTLNKVTLPKGFTWKDPHQVLAEKGTFTYKATYNAGSQYVEVDDIDIPVTVDSYVLEPTPVPATPNEPTATPSVPTVTPSVPTATPNEPTEAPNEPTATPSVPTATPSVPTATPSVPMATPNEPTEAPTTTPLAPAPTAGPQTPVPTSPVSAVTPASPGPATPTPKPDESNLTGNQIEDRTDLSLLLATGKQKGRGVRLTWRKWNGCTGYEVYCSFCDGKRNYKKLKTVSSTGKRVADHKNLKKNRAYKYYVVTYEIKDGRKHYLAKSPIIHVAMNKGPRTNAKSIKLNKKQVTLKKSKTFQIRAAAKKENKKKKLLAHEEIFRYYVDDKRVAGLSKKGRIRAKQKGVCTVFVIANNGVAGKMKVIVK